MSFRIEAGESVEAAVRRIAREQIDTALAELGDPAIDDHETVHQVRKRCKKVRGLIRLVRPALGRTYRRENAAYRDAARTLSYVRDAQSIIETLDDLARHFEDELDEDALAPVREQLLRRRREIAEDEVGLRERLEAFRERMQRGRERVAGWRLGEEGFDAVAGGLGRTYARGRDAMEQAFARPDAERFHEWRKRTKYHWYHVRLLRDAWEAPLEARRTEVHRLSDLLGEDHDLSVLRDAVRAEPGRYGGDTTVQALVGLADRRQVELRRRAATLGARVYAEKPKRIVGRLGAYWAAWQRETSAAPRTTHDPDLVTA